MMMKKIKKISALIALALVMCFLFTGCEGIGSIILSALSLDVETEDPATIMVADIAGKTEKSSGNVSGDLHRQHRLYNSLYGQGQLFEPARRDRRHARYRA